MNLKSCFLLLLITSSFSLLAQTLTFDNADSSFLLAEAHMRNHQIDSAICYYDEAVKAYKKIEKWAKVIKCYNQIGYAYQQKNDLDSSMGALEQAMAIGDQKFDSLSLSLAKTYRLIGVIYFLKHNKENTRSNYWKALNTYKIILAKDKLTPLEKEKIYSGIGDCYRSIAGYFDRHIHDLDSAFIYLEKAISVYRPYQNLGKISNTYSSLSGIFYLKGDYSKAIEYNIKSISTIAGTKEYRPIKALSSFENLGILYTLKGDYKNGLLYFKKALSLIDSLNLGNTFIASGLYQNMGGLYGFTQYIEEANDCFHRSLNILKDAPNIIDDEIAAVLDNIGTILYKKKDFNDALKYHRKALSVRPNDDVLRVNILHNIGRVHFATNALDSAEIYYLRALELIYPHKMGKSSIPLFNSFASLKAKNGNFQEAFIYLDKSLARLDPNKTIVKDQLEIHYTASQIYLDKGDYINALIHCKKALSIQGIDNLSLELISDSTGQDDLTLGLIPPFLNRHGEIFYKKYQKEKDIQYLKNSLNSFKTASLVIEKLRVNYNEIKTKEILAENALWTFENAIRVTKELYELTGDPKYIQEAFMFSGMNKSLILLGLIKHRDAIDQVLSKDLRDAEYTHRVEINYLKNQINNPRFKNDSIALKNWRADLFNQKRAYSDLILQIKHNHTAYYEMVYKNDRVSSQKIQQVLKADEVFIEYFYGEDNIFAFVLDADNLDLITIERTAELDQTILKYRDNLINPSFPDLFAQSSYKLYQFLLQPLENRFTGKKKIYLIPDDILHQIPFCSLIQEAPNSNKDDYGNFNFLIKNFELISHYSPTLFYNDKLPCNKDWEYDFSGIAPSFESKSQSTFSNVSNKSSLSGDSGNHPTLVYNQKSMENVGDIIGDSKRVKFYFDQDAIENNIKQTKLDSRILHFATHSEAKKNLFHSYIALGTTDLTKEDGKLYALEIYDLDISADLVFMGSCESGFGEITKGEGIMALTRGFIYHNVPNLVYSLWKIEDKFTGQFTEDFYKNVFINGKTYSAALRETQLKAIEEGGINAMPKFWAPFVIMGQ